MGHYERASDTRVEPHDGNVRWVDYGEIREMDPEDARWLGEQLITAAVEVEAQDDT